MYEEEKTITLRKPVTLAASSNNPIVYSELKMVEPTAGQIAKAQAGAATGTDVNISLIAAVCKVPRKVAEELCQRDFEEATDFFGQDSKAGSAEDSQN